MRGPTEPSCACAEAVGGRRDEAGVGQGVYEQKTFKRAGPGAHSHPAAAKIPALVTPLTNRARAANAASPRGIDKVYPA